MARQKTPVEPVQDWTLTTEQSAAVDLLASGKTLSEVAVAIEVPMQTVSEWCKSYPGVQAELNARRQELWTGTTDRLRSLLPKALEVLAEELKGGEPLAGGGACVEGLSTVWRGVAHRFDRCRGNCDCGEGASEEKTATDVLCQHSLSETRGIPLALDMGRFKDMSLVIVRGIPEQAQVCVFLLAQKPHALNAEALTHRTTALLKQTRIAHGMSAPRSRGGHDTTHITCFVQVTTKHGPNPNVEKLS